MADVLLYVVVLLAVFIAGCGVGFVIGRVKYAPGVPPPNYLGGATKTAPHIRRDMLG